MDSGPSQVFGATLKRLRLRAGFTQEELARRSQVSLHSISNLERGIVHRPRHDTANLLADALGLLHEERTAFLMQAYAISADPEDRSQLGRRSLLLPIQALIGREADAQTLCTLVERPDVRLLTVSGPGGIGKTRLALEVAHLMQPTFTHGAALVDLATLTHAPLVVGEIVRVLGIRLTAQQTPEHALHAWLISRQILLLLDNFEQVLAAAPLVADLLASAPHLKILVTSRHPLQLRGEFLYDVPPLGMPTATQHDIATLLTISSVQLFVERAQAVQATFSLTPSNGAAIAAICTRMDGLPLALELAAARLRYLSPHVLLERLTHRLDLLVGGPRDVPARQQTLRNTLAWSYDLLPPPAQQLFRRLAVCNGGCTLPAIEAIGQPVATDALRVLDLLAELVDQHVLQRVDTADASSPRFRMLETIRAFAGEQLAEAGEMQQASEAHLAYYCAFAETARPELYGANQADWLTVLDNELENFRAALNYSLINDRLEAGLRLARALTWFWHIHGYTSEGREWFATLLARVQASGAGVAPMVLAYAYNNAGLLAQTQGALADALTLYEASLTMRRQLDDAEGVAKVLNNLAILAQEQGEYIQATMLYQQSRAAYPAADHWPNPVHNLGVIALYQGNVRQAATYFAESLALWEHVGDRRNSAIARTNLADAFRLQGADQQAERLLQESLAAMSDLGDHWGRAVTLVHLGMVAQDRGQFAQAEASYQSALDIFADVDDPASLAWVWSNLGEVASAQGQWQLADASYHEGLMGYQLLQNRRGCAWALCGLSRVRVGLGQWGEATAQIQESFQLFLSLGDQSGLIHAAEIMARIVAAWRQYEHAIHYWAATTAVRQQVGIPRTVPEQSLYEIEISSLQVIVGNEAFHTQWQDHFDASWLTALVRQSCEIPLN